MSRLLHPVWLLLTAATDAELKHMVEYLKAENRILRDKLPDRLTVTPAERSQLVRLGKLLGSAIRDLITIVSPATFARWASGEKPTPRSPNRPGRPRTPVEVRELVIRLAEENAWGYTRILGELKRLGIHDVTRSTIANILAEHGIDPAPNRGRGTWHDFVRRHAQTLWACDFFTKNVWTLNGLVTFYVLFFIHIGTRKVTIAGMTPNPDNAWMTQQARNMAMAFDDEPTRPKYLVLDRDGKFTSGFDAVLESEGVELIRTPPRSPNMNPFAERWVRSIRSECLDHFVVFGEAHLRYIITEYVKYYYNTTRPHQGLDNVPLPEAAGEESPVLTFPGGKVVCEERLGGLLKSYRRAA